MKDNWKFWVMALLTAALLGFLGWRARRSLSSEAPSWIGQKRQHSPSSWLDARIRNSWPNLEKLINQAKRESAAMVVPLGSIQYFAVSAKPRQSVLWSTDIAPNPYFQPLQNIEHNPRASANRFVGYYGLDGKPLDFTTKQDPRFGKAFLTTVHLSALVEPGSTGLFFAVESTGGRITTNSAGQLEIALGRLPGPGRSIHAIGVGLPAGARLVGYTPAKGPLVSTEKGTAVFWINSLLESPGPNTVTFTLAK